MIVACLRLTAVIALSVSAMKMEQDIQVHAVGQQLLYTGNVILFSLVMGVVMMISIFQNVTMTKVSFA